MRELLDRIGVSTGTVTRGERSLMFSPRQAFTEDERARLAAIIDAIYADFVSKVASGRRRTVAEIEALARGRVWTGTDALANGLVDELGGLRDAVRIARSRAGLPADARVRPAVRARPLAGLTRARSSDDPRAARTLMLPGLPDVAVALGLTGAASLRMPPIRIR